MLKKILTSLGSYMKMTFAILTGLTLSLGFGCSQTDFNASGNLRKDTDQNSSMDGSQGGNQNIGDYGSLGDIEGAGGSDTNGGSAGMDGSTDGSSSSGADGSVTGSADSLAQKGKSLDLYFIIDVSGSLSRTDPDCDRLDALLDFKSELTKYLGDTEDVRASFVRFNDKARFMGTIDDYLGLSKSDFKDKFKDDICDDEGKTNTADAFEETVDKYNDLKSSPKDTRSAILFTDGMPTKGEDQLDRRIDEMKDVFGKKIFSVLLWDDSAASSGIFSALGSKDKAQKFLKKATGSSDRVKSVDDPSGIGKAIADFLK